MEPEFWLQRWQEGRTGWHQQEVDRLLRRHWPALGVESGGRVLVPLCGSSLDLAWLAAQGHPVVGVELSMLACEQFFARQELVPTLTHHRGFRRLACEGIELWCGDVFALQPDDLADVAAVYDRAALVALPPDMRIRYVRSVYDLLPDGCRGLLITLEYPPEERDGPPFAVDGDEVLRLFTPRWQVDRIDARDILDGEPRFRDEGVTDLWTAVYRLQRN